MIINNIKSIIEESLKLTPLETVIRFNEPMKDHTTFKVGGPADCWIQVKGNNLPSFCRDLLNRACLEGIPVFILGGGANIVVSDKGIRGIVLDMNSWKSCSAGDLSDILVFESGTSIDNAVNTTAEKSLGGLEFFAGMPGTVGGAVWMNARCYGSEISDFLYYTEIIYKDEKEKRFTQKRIYNKEGEGFGYKKSPFQKMDCLILKAAFKLIKSDKKQLLTDMDKCRNDRKEKGHYLFPCAGSAFKNNYDFGKPAGQVIDECGLKGLKTGGAQVAPFHGNIIINTGSASAYDIRCLVNEVTVRVKNTAGFNLEPEILFIGDWE